MQSASHVDTSIEDADQWELARNPTYVRMQKTLIERTVERDRLRAAYLELIRAVGPEVFDEVPDRFNIRELITQEQEINNQLNNI